ncbi:MAG: hypothetical protein ACI90Y_002020 [Polaromonas sp.]|jgi:hypothetical protein
MYSCADALPRSEKISRLRGLSKMRRLIKALPFTVVMVLNKAL